MVLELRPEPSTPETQWGRMAETAQHNAKHMAGVRGLGGVRSHGFKFCFFHLISSVTSQKSLTLSELHFPNL